MLSLCLPQNCPGPEKQVLSPRATQRSLPGGSIRLSPGVLVSEAVSLREGEEGGRAGCLGLSRNPMEWPSAGSPADARPCGAVCCCHLAAAARCHSPL